MLLCKENLTCESPMEIIYYSSKSLKNLCFYCGRERNLMPSNIELYPQCTSCQSKIAKVAERKQVVASDVFKKKHKTLV